MSRRFKQLLNLYLDDVIDQRGLIELKDLLANNVENQREFQRQCRLQQAMKQVQRTWVLAETSSQQVEFWRNPRGLVMMAAIAVFGCLFWLQSMISTASSDDVQSLASAELGIKAINAINLANENAFLVDSALEEFPILRPQQVVMSQSLRLGKHTTRQEPFLTNDWVLHPDEQLERTSVRPMPKSWHFQPSMRVYPVRVDQVLEVHPFVNPASFRFP